MLVCSFTTYFRLLNPQYIMLLGHTLASTAVNFAVVFSAQRLIRGIFSIIFRAFFHYKNFDGGLLMAL